MSPEPESTDDGALVVVLQAGEDVEGALVVALVGVFTDEANIPDNPDGLHRSTVKVFIDTDMDLIPMMRFQPTKEALSNIERAEQEMREVMERRKRGDYS